MNRLRLKDAPAGLSRPGSRNAWWMQECPTHGNTAHDTIVGCEACTRERHQTNEELSPLVKRELETAKELVMLKEEPDLATAVETCIKYGSLTLGEVELLRKAAKACSPGSEQ